MRASLRTFNARVFLGNFEPVAAQFRNILLNFATQEAGSNLQHRVLPRKVAGTKAAAKFLSRGHGKDKSNIRSFPEVWGCGGGSLPGSIQLQYCLGIVFQPEIRG